jgi:hypothetical protein
MLFEELLQLRNIDTLKAIRLVRHQDSRYDVRKLFEIGQLEIYQSLQSKPVFDGVEYVFSFLGIENTQALFVGFYRNLGRRYYAELPDKPNYVYAESLEDGLLWCHLEPLSAFDDLKERLVIKWGSPSSARSWVQRRLDKEVVEIRPQGFVKHFAARKLFQARQEVRFSVPAFATPQPAQTQGCAIDSACSPEFSSVSLAYGPEEGIHGP